MFATERNGGSSSEKVRVKKLLLIIHLQTHYRASLRWSVIVGEDHLAESGHQFHPNFPYLNVRFGEKRTLGMYLAKSGHQKVRFAPKSGR